MPKIFSYRGKTLEELKQMSIDEFSRLVKTRERRALKRGMTDAQRKLLEEIKARPSEFHKTHVREMVILPAMVGTKLGVFNGKEWVQVFIVPEMVGKRLGEFSVTTKRVKHSAPGVGATRGSKHIPMK